MTVRLFDFKRYPYYDYRATTNFKLNYEILSTKEVIQTPVGKFKNCLKIRGTGKTSFIGDSEIGSIIIEVLSEEWYAKDIGLIKAVRTKKLILIFWNNKDGANLG